MSFLLSLLSPAKKILFNKYTFIAIAIVGALIYHYYTINSLESKISTITSVLSKTKDSLKSANNTIQKMTIDVSQIKKSKDILNTSYIQEITKLKELIFDLNKKPKFKTIIKIKKVKVPVKVQGKTIYINKCEDIKVHQLDNNDSNNSIIRILSGVGK